MATYNAAYPALPALASGAPDSPAAAIVVGAPRNNDDTTAAHRQTKRRRTLYQSHPPRATLAEVQDAVNREFQVLHENATGAAGQPAWAVNMQNDLQNLQNAVQDIQNTVQNIQSRLLNGTTDEPSDAIMALRNDEHNLPPNFPANRLALDNLTGPELQTLLTFYGLQPSGTNADRLRRLKKFVGI